jgi:5-methylcytosine-specific restriction protein B
MAWLDDLETRLRANWAPGQQFTLEAVYNSCEDDLQQLHPENSHVRDKIRELLQQLRDRGRLEFIDNAGTYRLRPDGQPPGNLFIPECSREDLIRAMRKFDSDLRNTSDWARWEDNNSYKFAILFEGRRYPVKQIVHMATGAPRDTYFGGDQANTFVVERGLEVISLRSAEQSPLREGLETVLSRYGTARESEPFGSTNSLWSTFARLERALRESQPIQTRSSVSVKASLGQGNWAKVPWIALLDNRETTTAQAGVYGVLLFRQDMTGVYITLNQGVTQITQELGVVAGRDALRTRAREIRARCEALAYRGYTLDDEIDLRTDAGLGARFEDSTIAYKLYERGAVPSDSEILADVDALLEAYDRYISSKTEKPLPATPTPRSPARKDLAAVHRSFSDALANSHISFGAQHDDFVRTFLASLATKRFVILTGLSGSGKTQVALRFGDWLGSARLLVLPVRPDWTGAEALFGYEDALQRPREGGRAWHVPNALEFMLRAANDPDRPYLLVLDEMNLAHVERYFADVLSGMESGTACLPNLAQGTDFSWQVVQGGPSRLPVPDNLFVVGTVNVDETTYMFSPKVLDRANTIEFRVHTNDLLTQTKRPQPCAAGPEDLVRGFLEVARDSEWQNTHAHTHLNEFSSALRALHSRLTGSGFEFAHRVYYEAIRFAAILQSAGEQSVEAALDLQVMQKVLPRLHGSRRRLEPTLSVVGQFAYDLLTGGTTEQAHGNPFDPLATDLGPARLPRSFEKVQRMTRILRANQFVSFTE